MSRDASELKEISEPVQKKLRREGDSAAVPQPRPTLYLRCKHIVKPWELLNGFLRDHREALGLAELFGPSASTAAASGEAQQDHAEVLLKPAADIRCVYISSSRKPFFLLEMPNDDATMKLLAMSETVQFKGETVTVQRALPGVTVETERRKLEQRAAGSSTNASAAAVAPVRPAAAAVTSFVPRMLKK